MKIDYKVLWIEDHFKGIKNHIEGLRKKLLKYGFTLIVDKRLSISKDELDDLGSKLLKYNPYDMILFDYDLGNSQTGDTIANELRKIIFTDMIFYSGKPNLELRKILFDKMIEGVYVVNRTHLNDEVWPIIEDQVKRICDINSMRGVLLDEMSKIDLEIRQLLKTKYDALDKKDQTKQVNKYTKKLKERVVALEKIISHIDEETFSTMVVNPFEIEFNQVRCRLKSITKNELFDDSNELKIKQDLRNKFAHNMAIFDDENGTVTLNGFETEKYSFDEFTKMRKDLIELSNLISKIK